MTTRPDVPRFQPTERDDSPRETGGATYEDTNPWSDTLPPREWASLPDPAGSGQRPHRKHHAPAQSVAGLQRGARRKWVVDVPFDPDEATAGASGHRHGPAAHPGADGPAGAPQGRRPGRGRQQG